jgi:hypothetical protein
VDIHIYITHRVFSWFIGSSIGSAKERSVQLLSLQVAYVKERVVLEEVLVEDLVAVLLIHVPVLKV